MVGVCSVWRHRSFKLGSSSLKLKSVNVILVFAWGENLDTANSTRKLWNRLSQCFFVGRFVKVCNVRSDSVEGTNSSFAVVMDLQKNSCHSSSRNKFSWSPICHFDGWSDFDGMTFYCSSSPFLMACGVWAVRRSICRFFVCVTSQHLRASRESWHERRALLTSWWAFMRHFVTASDCIGRCIAIHGWYAQFWK